MKRVLEIILRGGVNQYYQINNLISQTYLYTLLQLSELVCIRDYTSSNQRICRELLIYLIYHALKFNQYIIDLLDSAVKEE